MEEEKNTNEGKGLGIAAMVLGIISLVLFCIWYLSIPCAICAIIFGILGKKKAAPKMATAGLVLGIIAVAIVVIFYILVAAGVATMFSFLSKVDYNQLNTSISTLNTL